jgi:hypothetical protein
MHGHMIVKKEINDVNSITKRGYKQSITQTE